MYRGKGPIVGIVVSLLVIASVSATAGYPEVQKEVVARVKPILTVDGYQYKDLNASGAVDPYENWMLPVEQRVEDLLSRMTLKEKIAQMLHPTFIPKPDGSPPDFLEDWMENKRIGFILVRDLPNPRAAANCMNQLQEWCEGSGLGIPIVASMDSIHGLSYVRGATIYPHNLGLAAGDNEEMVRELAEITREESLAIGVRMTLSPEVDVATEPRWGRVMETFGENADLTAKMIRIIVETMQGPELNENSLLVCPKHFPGAGPEMEGVDMAPIVFTLETMEYHLKSFRAAIEAGAGSVMPYYSIPLALDNMAALGSEPTLQGLLRETLGFEGIIQTDWGMEWGIQQCSAHIGRYISYDEALQIGLGSGIDVIGGASLRNIDDIARLIGEGEIDGGLVENAVRRILTAKFKLGIFENPYVDPDHAEQVVGCEEHQRLSLEAARQSITLAKNDNLLPLGENMRILVAGLRAGDIESLTGGWTCRQEAPGIAQELQDRLGEDRVIYEPNDIGRAAELAENCDVAVVVVGEPYYVHSPPWGADTLELTSSQAEMLGAIHDTGTPIVVVVLLGRPYILTWCDEHTSAIMMAYYPGTQGANAIADVLLGDYNPHGKLPFQFPRSMDQVLAQREDLPYDIGVTEAELMLIEAAIRDGEPIPADLGDPLYDYGFGLSYGVIPPLGPEEPEIPLVPIIVGAIVVVVVIVAIAVRKSRSR